MMIVRTHDRFFLRSDQTDSQRDGKDQTVYCSGKNQQSRRITQEQHDQGGHYDKSDGDPVLILGDRRMERLQEGNRRIGCSYDRSHCRAEKYQSCESVSDLSGALTERVCCRVGCIQSRSLDYYAKNCQEQEYTHDGCDSDTHDRALVDLL